MKDFRKHLFCIIGGILLGLLIAMGVHRCNRQPVETKVERDTIVQYDTIPHWYPKPVEVTKTRTEYKWLTRVVTENVGHGNNSVDSAKNSASFPQDSVLVEVPITSKHYGSKDYDAWVSGYEPSLDSIKVYKETQYITETITRTVKDNKHFFLDVGAGCEKNFKTAGVTPFAEVGATFKPSRWSIGVTGGYKHVSGTGEPYARVKLSYDIIAF